jgi:hypothetical protein
LAIQGELPPDLGAALLHIERNGGKRAAAREFKADLCRKIATDS